MMQQDSERHWLTPAMATLIVGAFTLGTTALVSLTYTPLRNDLTELRRELVQIKTDPGPKPETRVWMEAAESKLAELGNRLARMEERLANLHIYLMQAIPPPKQPPIPLQRRGDTNVFRPEMPM